VGTGTPFELYLCRHGETAWTLSGQHTGITDIPLTKKGEEQARLLQHRLKQVHFCKVFCSPRKRALQTCAFAGMKGEEEDSDLQEWDYGEYEGLTSAEIKRLQSHWHLFSDGAPGGESPEEVGKRADRFLAKLRLYKEPVVIFSHGHFSRVLAARWVGLSVEAGKCLYLSPASLSILGFEKEQPVIKLWNQRFM
jgi:broad specificity phosphatase PhoE